VRILKAKNDLYIVLIGLLFQSCSSKAPFTNNELKWFRPYEKIDTSIFISEQEHLADTIIFFGTDTTIVKLRNLEQGFRNEKTFKITYLLTDNSYHKLIFLTGKKEPENFISVTDNDNWTKPLMEITFLGSIYDNSFLDKRKNDTTGIVHFDKASANYRGVNVAEGIESFDFDFKKGIIGFMDKFNRRWSLRN
jgi:hypothetical protein